VRKLLLEFIVSIELVILFDLFENPINPTNPIDRGNPTNRGNSINPKNPSNPKN